MFAFSHVSACSSLVNVCLSSTPLCVSNFQFKVTRGTNTKSLTKTQVSGTLEQAKKHISRCTVLYREDNCGDLAPTEIARYIEVHAELCESSAQTSDAWQVTVSIDFEHAQ